MASVAAPTLTLPIVFASLSDTKPESTVSAPEIVSEPAPSKSAAWLASKFSEFATSPLSTVTR